MATSTPWGVAQESTQLCRGIVQYSTAGHGGIHVSPSLNAQIHEAWRVANGWYEEDCDWAIVAYHFPAVFPKEQAAAIRTLKAYNPDEYATVTGKRVKLSESHKLQERAFRKLHKADLMVISAVGAWHDNVPAGMVGVTAALGGRDERGHYGELRNFLVPAEEYHGRSGLLFVVSPERHQEVDRNLF